MLGKNGSKSESEEKTPPNLEKTKQGRVKEVLGREFRVVKNGLDPVEVMSFLEEVAGSSDVVLRRLEHFASLRRLSETMEVMSEETRQMAGHIKEQARKEAEVERAQIIKETKRKAEEMIAHTRKSCIASIEGTNSLLLEANVKAREVEDMAFKKAKEMLAIVMREIQQNIHNTANATYRDLTWGIEPFGRLPNPQAEVVKTPPDARVQEAVPTKENVPELLKLEETFNIALGPQTMGIGVEEEKEPINIEAPIVTPKGDNSNLYSGKMTLLILGGAGLPWMLQLRQRLSDIPGLHIILEAGSDTGGNIMTLSLDKPIALSPILLEMPNVERVVEEGQSMEEPSGDEAKTLGNSLPGNPQRTTLMVVLGENGKGNHHLDQ